MIKFKISKLIVAQCSDLTIVISFWSAYLILVIYIIILDIYKKKYLFYKSDVVLYKI